MPKNCVKLAEFTLLSTMFHVKHCLKKRRGYKNEMFYDTSRILRAKRRTCIKTNKLCLKFKNLFPIYAFAFKYTRILADFYYVSRETSAVYAFFVRQTLVFAKKVVNLCIPYCFTWNKGYFVFIDHSLFFTVCSCIFYWFQLFLPVFVAFQRSPACFPLSSSRSVIFPEDFVLLNKCFTWNRVI